MCDAVTEIEENAWEKEINRQIGIKITEIRRWRYGNTYHEYGSNNRICHHCASHWYAGTKEVRFFTKYCIPAPVIGGLIFPLLPLSCVAPIFWNSTLTPHFNLFPDYVFLYHWVCGQLQNAEGGGSKVVKFLVIAPFLRCFRMCWRWGLRTR